MELLTEKYKAWAKHPQNYTAEQVLNQIVADLEWLNEEQTKEIDKIIEDNETIISLIYLKHHVSPFEDGIKHATGIKKAMAEFAKHYHENN